MGSDWTAIISNTDATHFPEAKMSNVLKRTLTMLGLKDCHRHLYGNMKIFSRYYKKNSRELIGSMLQLV